MRIWAFSVRRWQFTLVLFGLLIAVGANSYLNIPRSEDPVGQDRGGVGVRVCHAAPSGVGRPSAGA